MTVEKLPLRIVSIETMSGTGEKTTLIRFFGLAKRIDFRSVA